MYGYVISQANEEDAEAVLKLQFLCYQSEAALYDDYSIPPLVQSLTELQAEFKRSTVFVCRLKGEVIGSVRATRLEDRCFIGRLMVHPRFQRQGLGSKLMSAVEDHFQDAAFYELFTGHRSENNLRLYQRLGYKQFKIEKVSQNLQLIFLEKPGTNKRRRVQTHQNTNDY